MEQNQDRCAEEKPAGLTDVIESFTHVLGEEASIVTKIAMGFFGVAGTAAGIWLGENYINNLKQLDNLPQWIKYAIDAGSGISTGILFSQIAKLPEEIVKILYANQDPTKQVGGAHYSIGEKEIKEAEIEIAKEGKK